MICAIGIDQQKALATAIHKILKEKESFNLDDVIKQVYSFVLDASQNKDQALAYARLVPKWTGVLLQTDAPLRKKLGASIDPINAKADLYEASIDNVVKDLDPVQDPIQKLVEGQKIVDEIIEQEMKELAEARLDSIIDKANEKDVLIPSFMSTLAFESGSEPFTFNIQRKLLNTLRQSTVSENGMPVLEYPGVGRVYLRPVKTQSLGEKNWRKASDGTLKYVPQDADVAYALVDSNGDFVYMDPDGNVVDQEKGRVPYWNTYRANDFVAPDSKGEMVYHPHILKENAVKTSYQDRQRNSFMKVLNEYSMRKFNTPFAKLNPETQKMVGEYLRNQLEYNYYAERIALEKPGTVIKMNITGGSFGRRVIDKAAGKDGKVVLSEVMEPNTLQVRIRKETGSPQAVFLKDGQMKTVKVASGIREKDVNVIMELFFNDNLMIKDSTGKVRPITNQERRDQLEKFIFPGKGADKFDGVRIFKKDLQVGVDSKGNFTIKMKPLKDGLYNFKAPLVDVSQEPNSKQMVRAYLSRAAQYDITEKFGDSYSVPTITESDGNKVLSLTPTTYNEWIRTNNKFVTDPVAKTAEETKDSFFTFEPTREAVRDIISEKPVEQREPVEQAILSEKPSTVAGRIKEVNDAFQEAKVTDPLAAEGYRRELEDLRQQERDERLWEERGFIGRSVLPEAVKPEPAPEATPTVTDSSPAVPTNTKRGFEDLLDNSKFDKLTKQKTGNVKATPEQIEEARKWYESSPLRQHFPFEAVFDAVNQDNPNSVAQWSIDGIKLFKGADYSDLYHEAWHGFSQTFLTPDQRKEMYSEMRKKKGDFVDYDGNRVSFTKATDLQLEEYIAEKFREYVLSKGLKVDEATPKTNNIFKRIFNFLKELFGFSTKQDPITGAMQVSPRVSELFEKLRVGNISQFTFNASNRGFGVLYSTITAVNPQEQTRRQLNYQETQLIINSVDSVLSEVMDYLNGTQGSGTKRFSTTLFKSNRNKLIAYKAVKTTFEKRLGQMKIELDKETDPVKKNSLQYNYDLLKWAVDNFGSLDSIEANLPKESEPGLGVIYAHIQKSRLMSNEDKASAYEKDELSEAEQTASGRTSFERSGQDNSLKDLAAKEVLYLLRGLPKFDKNGKPELNEFGFNKLAESDKVFNYLAKELQGTVNAELMYAKLQALSEKTDDLGMANTIGKLLGKLGSQDEATGDISQNYHDNYLFTNFWQTFNPTVVPLVQMTVTEMRNGESEISYRVTVGEASSSSMSVMREWENRFNIETTQFIREEVTDIKKQRFAETKNYLDVPALLKKYPTKDSIGYRTNEKTGAVLSGNKMFEFLSDVGIKLTYSSAIVNALATNPELQTVVRILYEDIAASVEENRPINSIKELFREENQNRLGNLKELESKLGLGGSSKFMVTNAEGNTQFEHSLNSTMSVMVEAINRANSFQELIAMPHMAHLDPERNPFTKSSIWLRSIFEVDENGNFTKKRLGADLKPIVLHLNNLSGVKAVNEFGGEDGVATASSDPATKLILDFHSMMMLGRPENPRHADKSSSYTMYVDKVNEPGRSGKKNSHKYIDDVEFFLDGGKRFNGAGFGKTYDMNGSMARERVMAYVLPYVKSELKRIEIMKSLKEKGIQNYDFEYMKNGQKFVLFDDVFSKELKEDLIEAGVDNFEALRPRVEQAITNYFNKVILDVQKMEARSSFRDPAIANRIRRELKAENMVGALKEKDINLGAIASFAINSWLHNLEAVTMLYGDLALYNHAKEEFHKRNAGIASTGLLFRSDSSALKFAQSLGRKYAQKNKLKQKDLAQDGTYDSAVIEDSVPASKYFEPIETVITNYYNELYPKDPAKAALKIKKALKPYREGEIKEGDAQGWVTFDFYRIMLTLEGKWTSEQDELYNRIVSGDTKVDIEQVMQFFPIKKVQYWGYLQTAEGPPVLAMHKFSLMPLVPNVIKGTNLEKLHHRMINEGIDYATFKSGSKIGTVTENGKSDRFYSDQATRTFDENGRLTKNTAFFNYLKDQLETGDSFKEKVTSPSQMRKLIIDGLVEQGVPKDYVAEQKAKGKSMNQIRKAWDKLDDQKKREASKDYVKYRTYEQRVEALTRDKYQKLLKKIDFQEVDGKPTGNIDKLVRYIQKQFDAQDLSQHEKEFIAAHEGRLKNDLSLSLSADKIEKVLNAIVVRELVKQKVKGEGLVQVSSAGFEKVGTDSALGFYSLEKDKDGNEFVQAAEIKIALQGDFAMLLDLPKVVELAKKENITKLEALNRVINDEEWLSKKDNRKMLMLTAARIPVQGKNSMEFFKVKEFLPPNAGNMIVVPSEIVAKAGSDFDIDKLFTMMPTLVKDEKTGRVFYDSKSKENLVMESQIDILSDPNEFVNLIRPNATDIFDDLQAELKDDVSEFNPKDSLNPDPERVDKDGKPIISPTRIFEVPYNIYKQNTNSVGKAVLGIGAVDNTYNVLFNRIGMHMNLTSQDLTLDDYNAIRNELDQYSGRKAPKYITYQDSKGENVRISTKEARGKVKEFAYQTLRLPHNTMTLDNGDEVISLSDTFDAQSDNRISDVINQMINGWVDVAKDPWIFNIQGNKEITPTLLFLVQAGVPIRDAVYFVSQPLVREYIEMQRDKKSTFAGPLGRKPSKPTLSAYEAEREILVKVIGVGTYATKGGVWIDRGSQFNASQSLNKGFNKDNPYSAETMRGRIKSYNDSKKNDEPFEYDAFDKAAFLHFLEVEKMAKAVKDIKTNTNVDTQRQTTLFEARAKENAIRQIGKSGRFPKEMVKKLQEQTAIGSFFDVLEWQQKMWGPLFKMRDNPLLNRALDDMLDLSISSDMVEATFGTEEKFANEFRNDFLVYLFQRNMYKFDLNKVMKEGYRGYRSSENTPVVPLEFLDFAVYFQDGVVYADIKQLAKDWENLDVLSKEYNVAAVKRTMFDTPEQYARFVFEREYLRSQYPLDRLQKTFFYQERFKANRAFYNESVPDNQIAYISYEEILRDMALENSYNMAHMFTGNNTMAHKLTQIIKSEEFRELRQNYDVLKVLGVKKSGRFWNIKLSDRLLESDDVEKYHENLKELSNPNTIKVNTSYENKVLLADFFKKLDVYSILQSGMNTNSELSLQRIVNQDTFLQYMQPISTAFLQNLGSKEAKAAMLDFANKFAFTANASSTRGKLKNYMKTTSRNVFQADEYYEEAEQDVEPTFVYVDDDGRTVYDITKASQEQVEKMVTENPNTLFVFNDTVFQPSTKPTKKSGPIGHHLKVLAKKYPNLIGIPTRLNYSDQFGSAAIKDTVKDNVQSIPQEIKDRIDSAIETIKEWTKTPERKVAFSKKGYGQILLNANDLTGTVIQKKTSSIETFKYISESLAKVGHVNVNYAEKIGDARAKLSEKQPVTDEDVYNQLKFCLGL